jgi:hypothetical protein
VPQPFAAQAIRLGGKWLAAAHRRTILDQEYRTIMDERRYANFLAYVVPWVSPANAIHYIDQGARST